MRPALFVQRVILCLSLVGMFIGIFWDTLFAQIHADNTEAASTGGIDECPYLSFGAARKGNEPLKPVEKGKKIFIPNIDENNDIEPEINYFKLINITETELALYNGQENEQLPILLAIDNIVFDVTSSREKYSQNMGYHALAGRIATRALAISSLDEDELSNDLSDLTDEQVQVKDRWKNYFLKKYPVTALMEESLSNLVSLELMERQLRDLSDETLYSAKKLSSDGLFTAINGTIYDVKSLKWLYGPLGARNQLLNKDLNPTFTVPRHLLLPDALKLFRVES